MTDRPCIMYTPMTKTFWSEHNVDIPFHITIKTKHISHPFLRKVECDYVVLRDKNKSTTCSLPLEDFIKHTPSVLDPLGDVCYDVNDVWTTLFLFGDHRPFTWHPKHNQHTELACQVIFFVIAFCLSSWLVSTLV